MPVDYNFSHYEDPYLSTKITVDPVELGRLAGQLTKLADSLGSDVGKFFTLINSVKYLWAGADSTEAQEFFDQLNPAMAGLFGTGDSELGPDEGWLIKVVVGLGRAAQNYGWAEQIIKELAKDILAELNDKSPDTTGGWRFDVAEGPVQIHNHKTYYSAGIHADFA